MPTPTVRTGFDRRLRWLAPAGHLGDALILSAVLKAGHEQTGERFGVLRLQPFSSLFMGHPAVAQIASVDLEEGAPPLQRTDWWSLPFADHSRGLRHYARLSRMLFGRVLGEEGAWAPVGESDFAGLRGLPFSRAPILLAPGVDSPRKEWPLERWTELARGLAEATGVPLVQVGLVPLQRIPGALNVSGKLQPRELLALIGRSQACVSVDPFVVHGARMQGTPALNLLGPVSPRLHAYDTQVNVHSCSPCEEPCLELSRGQSAERCPKRVRCMEQLAAPAVLERFLAELGPRLDAGRALLS